jgi:hypothetical protein
MTIPPMPDPDNPPIPDPEPPPNPLPRPDPGPSPGGPEIIPPLPPLPDDPPLDPRARGSLQGLHLGDGRQAVTFGGHPVHTYPGDDQAGQDNGESAQGEWYTISASGPPTPSAR